MSSTTLSPTTRGQRVDIAVIGGGPAGAAAALTLLKYSSLSVAVVEASDYDRARVGETVSPGMKPMLEFLGVWGDFVEEGHLPAYGTSAAWGSPHLLSRDFLFTGHGDGWLLDRGRFDRMLARAVRERGGALLTGARMTSWERSSPEGWRLEITRAGVVTELHARFVVDASGRKATFARRLGARRRVYDGLLGVVGYYDLPEGYVCPQLTLVESVPDGWWYSAPLPGSQIIVAFMSDADVVRRRRAQTPEGFEGSLADAPHTRERLGAGRLRPGIHVRSACSQRLDPVAGPGWLAAGDAAAAFDPLSAMGIGFALASGSNAARVAHDVLCSDGSLLPSYEGSIQRHVEEYLSLRRRYYLLEQRFPERAFWAARHHLPSEIEPPPELASQQ